MVQPVSRYHRLREAPRSTVFSRTRPSLARKGRASYLREATKDVPDPGSETCLDEQERTHHGDHCSGAHRHNGAAHDLNRVDLQITGDDENRSVDRGCLPHRVRCCPDGAEHLRCVDAEVGRQAGDHLEECEVWGNTGTGDQGHQRGGGDEDEHDDGCGTGGVPRQRCRGIDTAGTFAEACEEVDIDQPGTQGGHPINLAEELRGKLFQLVSPGPAWVGINRLSGKAQCLWLIDPVYADKDGKFPNTELLAATSRTLGGFWTTIRT